MGATDKDDTLKMAAGIPRGDDMAASIERGIEDVKAGRTIKQPKGMTVAEFTNSEAFKNFMNSDANWKAEENKHQDPKLNGSDAFQASSKDWPGFLAHGATADEAIALGKKMAIEYKEQRDKARSS